MGATDSQIRSRSSETNRSVRALSIFALGLMAAFAAPSAHAQSCVLCYTSVAGGGASVIRAFQWGILTLLVPALTLFGGVFYMIYRRALAATEEQSAKVTVRPAVRPVLRPVVSKSASRMPIHGTLPTTAS
jgi:hypothetical protein